MRAFMYAIVALLLLVLVATPSTASLLSLLDRPGGISLLSERFPNPFSILEHVPFSLDRDLDIAEVALARVDWKETPTHHLIMIDIPGLKKEELKIEVGNKILQKCISNLIHPLD
ncbi:hypothetical protein Cni_G10021 [Canna indica]|uniref:SHSP domain-containing protein n=1 Tax=Canna indica TaxID=4628 RepID=A0AAQ3QA93_9LILI|nr:hypothetical protein Cni_G10021 [Canna indica]